MNSAVEYIIDLLQDKSNLSSPYRSGFVISSSCFFKTLSSILIMIKKNCLTDWKIRQWRTKMLFARIFKESLLQISRSIVIFIFWDFLMFYHIFFSPKVKRCTIITYKHRIYELAYELPNILRLKVLRKLENIREVSKLHRMIA